MQRRGTAMKVQKITADQIEPGEMLVEDNTYVCHPDMIAVHHTAPMTTLEWALSEQYHARSTSLAPTNRALVSVRTPGRERDASQGLDFGSRAIDAANLIE